MEAELEGMLVGAWIQGDRTKLLLQKEFFARCLIETKEEREGVVNELSSRATRQEKLRKICETRVQDLEHEVVLLSEQLGVSARKLRETEKALRRERTNRNYSRRCCFKRSDEGAPTPADRVPQRVFPSFADCDGHSCEGGDGTDGGRQAAAGELRVVERLVEGLLEDNLRLESIVRQLQGGQARDTRTEGACTDAEPAGGATGADTTRPEDAEVIPRESLRDRQPRRKGTRGNEVESREKDYDKIDRNVALSKIQALTGMVLAQEEIETLLCQELDELKQAWNGERLWRLLIRWSRVLENKGYATEKDVRSAGLLEELQQRLSTDNPGLQGLH